MGKSALDEMCVGLGSTNESERIAALKELAELAKPDSEIASIVIYNVSKNKSKFVPFWEKQGERVLTSLAEGIESGSPPVRIWSAFALHLFGDAFPGWQERNPLSASEKETLLVLLKAREAGMTQASARCRELLAEFRDSDNRKWLHNFLGKLDFAAFQILLEECSNPDAHIRLGALRSMEGIIAQGEDALADYPRTHQSVYRDLHLKEEAGFDINWDPTYTESGSKPIYELMEKSPSAAWSEWVEILAARLSDGVSRIRNQASTNIEKLVELARKQYEKDTEPGPIGPGAIEKIHEGARTFLASKDRSDRACGCRLICLVGGWTPENEKTLIALTQGDNRGERKLALHALGVSGGDGAQEILLACLEGSDKAERLLALQSAARFTGANAARALVTVEALNKEYNKKRNSDITLQWALEGAIKALNRATGGSKFSDTVRELEDPEETVRLSALTIIRTSFHREPEALALLPQLIAMARDESKSAKERSTALMCACWINADEEIVCEAALDFTESADPEIRRGGEMALDHCHGADEVKAWRVKKRLLKMLEDPDPSVVSGAISNIFVHGGSKKVKAKLVELGLYQALARAAGRPLDLSAAMFVQEYLEKATSHASEVAAILEKRLMDAQAEEAKGILSVMGNLKALKAVLVPVAERAAKEHPLQSVREQSEKTVQLLTKTKAK